MRAWFDDIMVLVWFAEELAIPECQLPNEEERKLPRNLQMAKKQKAKRPIRSALDQLGARLNSRWSLVFALASRCRRPGLGANSNRPSRATKCGAGHDAA